MFQPSCFLASVGECRWKPNQVDCVDDYRDEPPLVRVQQAAGSLLANDSRSCDFPEVTTKPSAVENSQLRKEQRERSQQRSAKKRVKKGKCKETGIIIMQVQTQVQAVNIENAHVNSSSRKRKLFPFLAFAIS